MKNKIAEKTKEKTKDVQDGHLIRPNKELKFALRGKTKASHLIVT